MLVIFVLMSISSMSHTHIKKHPCRPVNFKGLGPMKKHITYVKALYPIIMVGLRLKGRLGLFRGYLR